MRSDPFEHHLPDDLSELAAQLSDDANHLAARYPAGETQLRVTAKCLTLLQRIAPAAAVLLAICGTMAIVLRPWQSSNVRIDAPQNQNARLANSVPDPNSLPSPNPAGVQEVGFNLNSSADLKLDDTQMLRVQLNAFEQVIHRLQQQIEQHEKSETETQKLVESLQKEVKELHQRLDDRDKAQTR